MSASTLGRKLFAFDSGGILFRCPGCKDDHCINVKPSADGKQRPTWSFNGDGDKPTFMPSIHIRTGSAVDPTYVQEEGDPPKVCHSFIKDGRIQFLDDCDHELAGKTVDLPDWIKK